MTNHDFISLVQQRRLHDAIRMLRNMSEKKMTWEITDEINRIDSSYGYLLKYAMDGFDDPGRSDIYDSLVAQLLICSTRLDRYCRLQTDNGTYSSTVRHAGSRSIASTIDALNTTIATTSTDTPSRPAIEDARTALFDRIWTAFPISRDDHDALARFLADEAADTAAKHLAVSALMMGCLEYFDDARIDLLADVYTGASDQQLALEALIALLLSLWTHRSRPMSQATHRRIAALADLPHWEADVRTAFIELIRTRDTERITRKFQDEIIPEMMRHKDDFIKSIRDIKKGQEITEADLEENPEWQDILDKTGLGDKLRELTELQEEGSDVFMATFAHLKSFPFFYNVANWFLPFDPAHSCTTVLGNDATKICRIIDFAPMICDSDKYSMILAMTAAPESQRSMMLSQIAAQTEQLDQLNDSSLILPDMTRRRMMSRYVQNLYRFFRLFRRKDDFRDPFAGDIDLSESEILRPYLSDAETLHLVAEFYFRHKYYPEALRVFRLYDDLSMPDDKLYQQMGFCMQKSGDNAGALRYYEQAELLNSQSAWTLRHIAACHRAARDYRKALSYYRRLDAMQPDNLTTTMHIGQCLLATADYAEAVKAFYKVDYLSGDSRAVRPLAWALLMAGNIDEATRLYNRLLADNPEPDDLLNAGHLALSQRQYALAISRYADYIRRAAITTDRFVEAVEADRADLRHLGVDDAFIPLVVDAACYEALRH